VLDQLQIDGRGSGWDIEQEDFDWIDSLETGVPFAASDLPPLTAGDLELHKWIRIERQRLGSCNGHCDATITERCQWDVTGEVVQCSDLAGYYGAQYIDAGKKPGRGDRGSTIAGGVKYMQEYGICPESQLPKHYPYDWQKPPAFSDNIIGTARRLTSFEECRLWIGGNLGGIAVGVPWSTTGNSHVVERSHGGNSSWHAVPLLQFSWKYEGFLAGPNSWGRSFGDDGWFHWSKRYIDEVIRQRYVVFIGVSDLPNLAPRSHDWQKEGFFA
jgi:hypothetical protein